MATFLTLKADVDELATRTVPDVCYRMLTDDLNRNLRILAMEATTTLSASSETVALPSGFLEGRHAYIDSDPRVPVQIVSEFTANLTRNDTGAPYEAVVTDGSLTLNPAPDGTYSIFLRYLSELDDLSGDADTNDVLNKHYNIYLFGALYYFTKKTRDMEMAATWGADFMRAMDDAKKAETRERYGASPLQMQVRASA